MENIRDIYEDIKFITEKRFYDQHYCKDIITYEPDTYYRKWCRPDLEAKFKHVEPEIYEEVQALGPNAIVAGGFVSYLTGETSGYGDIDVFMFSPHPKMAMYERNIDEYSFYEYLGFTDPSYEALLLRNKDWRMCRNMVCPRYRRIDELYQHVKLPKLTVIVMKHQCPLTDESVFGLLRNFDLAVCRRALLGRMLYTVKGAPMCEFVIRADRVEKYQKRVLDFDNDSNGDLPRSLRSVPI